MLDKDAEFHFAAAMDVTHHCRCGDHESDHVEGVFVARHTEPGSRACIVPFCRCGSFIPMTAWQLPERDVPPEAGP